MYETSNSYTGYNGWFGDETSMATGGEPFIVRGGKIPHHDGTISGIYAFNSSTGAYRIKHSTLNEYYYWWSFRPVLIVHEGV